ncbi:RNA methyltransferase [Pseudoduganella danionis]|uniref:tRNA (cytidine/uridine-2'-O-)-methyltransferase TrmJ n=1 Tax=Pseudoduganella danionis TaxID=1890295 RepID=A0ABW9SKW6_9BURK|nr:RNA methyltransferase [Pseudoduganella danionis]MTW32239.1 TrmJ/YjtD family RNA methyltransferase [Pseudoduganella danionis]
MNLPEINTNLFKRLRFILVETSRAGNIGAVARAMKTMGFTDLVLVTPRFEGALDDPEAIAFASGAGDILASARVVGSMAEALQGINFAAAVSARLREYSPPVLTPRALAGQLLAQPELHAALIFGNERFGLPNEIVEQCNVLINIPANPDYSSLNLSQAAQVLAYECRMAALGGAPSVRQPGGDANDIGFQGEAASVAQIEGMYQHLEQALVEIGFLDASNPRKLMPRLKRMFARAQLEQEEVNILRGIARHMTGRRPAGSDK